MALVGTRAQWAARIRAAHRDTVDAVLKRTKTKAC